MKTKPKKNWKILKKTLKQEKKIIEKIIEGSFIDTSTEIFDLLEHKIMLGYCEWVLESMEYLEEHEQMP